VGATMVGRSVIKTDGSGALYFFSGRGLDAQTGQVGSISTTDSSGLAVTKFGPTGQIVYSTVLDISSWTPEAVDSSGFVYAAGYGVRENNRAPILLKLNQAGNALVFRNTIEFTDVNPQDLAVDSASNIYLLHFSNGFNPNSSANRLTATPGALRTAPNSGALLKFDATGVNTVYRTFLNTGSSIVSRLAIDSRGAAYLNDSGAFTKINPSGSQAEYVFQFRPSNSAFYNGSVNSIAVNAANELVFTGYTTTPGPANLPVRNAIQPNPGGNPDVIVGKINAAGTALVFLTYFGGSGFDAGNTRGGVAIDPSGNIWFGGVTSSTNLRLVGATQSALLGEYDGFLTQLKGDGSEILFSTYVGSSSAEDTTISSDMIAADGGGAYILLGAPNGTLAAVNAIQPIYPNGPPVRFRNYIIGKWATTLPAAPPNRPPHRHLRRPRFRLRHLRHPHLRLHRFQRSR